MTRGAARISLRGGGNVHGAQSQPSQNGKVTGFDPLFSERAFFTKKYNNIKNRKIRPHGGQICTGPKVTSLPNLKTHRIWPTIFRKTSILTKHNNTFETNTNFWTPRGAWPQWPPSATPLLMTHPRGYALFDENNYF